MEKLSRDPRKLLRVMDTFILLVVVMVLRGINITKLTKLNASNVCSLLCVNYTSIKLFQNRERITLGTLIWQRI